MVKTSLQYTTCVVLMLVSNGDFYNITLPCKVQVEVALQYRKVTWYKVDEDGSGITGLVLKNLQTNETRLYKSAQRSYQVGEGYTLILTNSSAQDCGKYRCTLWPPVGHQIKEGDYDFYLEGCPQPANAQRADVPPSKLHSSVQRDSTVSVVVGLVTAVLVLIVVLGVLAVMINNPKLKQMVPYKSLQATTKMALET
ncbi:hypothetical protein GN956_G18314 [Arapaima gigas]